MKFIRHWQDYNSIVYVDTDTSNIATSTAVSSPTCSTISVLSDDATYNVQEQDFILDVALGKGIYSTKPLTYISLFICLESVPVPVPRCNAVCVASKEELLQVDLPTYEFVSLPTSLCYFVHSSIQN